MKAATHRLPQRCSRCFAVNPPIDHSDDFLREQLRQLQAQGRTPEAAAEIVAKSMKAVSDSLGKLLERIESGESLAELERSLSDGEQAQP